jgi:ribonuclease P protein component
MPKHQRLSRVDFSSMNVARSRRFYGTYFTMSVSPQPAENTTNEPKFACVVSKKIAAHAVDRNRIKRRCREALRTTPGTVTGTRVVVFYAKKESKNATFQEVVSDVNHLLSQIK